MAQTRLLAGAGLGALLLSLLALLPARVGAPLLGLPRDAAAGFSGTLWAGTVERVVIGDTSVGPVHWDARFGRLLAGELAADIEATLPDGFLNGTVGIGFGGRIGLEDLEAAVPLALVAPAAGPAGGQVSARFDTAGFRKGRVTSAVGSLRVSGVTLPLPSAAGPPPPGTYEVTFASPEVPDDQPLTGQLRDAGGPLEITGTVAFTPPRSYVVDGTARPRPDAPPALRQALAMLGPATPDGSHPVSLAGSF